MCIRDSNEPRGFDISHCYLVQMGRPVSYTHLITYHPINIVNWKEYPYQPQVSFRIAYTNDAILVHYKVVEDLSLIHI